MGKNSKEFVKLRDDLLGLHAQRFNAALQTMDDETFALNYTKVLEYVQPKLQRTEVSTDSDDDNTINIIHSYAEPLKQEQDKEIGTPFDEDLSKK